jgi:AbrB family looped-hinge helix DNA binding protein
MTRKEKTESFCEGQELNPGCCSVESVVSLDERGQMVLPKEIREKAGINPGDKLVLIAMEKKGKFCCLALIKAEDFEEMVKSLISPVMEGLTK